MANLHLVTGYQGSDHVTAADHGSLYAGIFGVGNYVLNRGSKLAATVVTSNKISIADGDIILQGRHIRLNVGSTVSLTISSGSQGYYRNDLIVARYSRNSSTGIEQANLVVVKGTATTGTPSDPTTYESDDLLNDNAATVDFPLYRIPISGITVGTPVRLFEVVSMALVGEDGKINSDFLPAMNYIPTSQKGAASGVAPLNASKKIANTYLPVGDANGVASLDSSGKVPNAQICTEGTFSLSTSTSGLSFENNLAIYIKIGRFVYFRYNGKIVYNGTGGGDANVKLDGVPAPLYSSTGSSYSPMQVAVYGAGGSGTYEYRDRQISCSSSGVRFTCPFDNTSTYLHFEGTYIASS